MPHASVKLRPGVDQNATPALNEAGISTSNLIRFIYDKGQGALVQKLGGWTKFFPDTISAIVRSLCAWEDTNAATYLAVGAENDAISGHAELSVISNGVQQNITPRASTDNVTPIVTTVAGSSYVTITDNTTTGITSYDSVFIETQISVGGLILFGQYPCITLSSNAYQIIARDVFGNPLGAATSSSSPAVPSFSTQGLPGTPSNVITVTLNDHGYLVGDNFSVLVSTSVGGVTLYGNYTIQSVPSANTFTIQSNSSSSATATVSMNTGLCRYTYSYGVGALPSGTGYGAGAYGSGGYGTGTAIPPSTGTPISASDWTLDNWGQVLLSSPVNNTIFQPIYQWDPTSGSPTATVIPEAPTICDGFFVAMPQRQVIAWGTTFSGIQDPLLIRWCDVNNYDSWIGTVINQAGSYRVPRGSRIVGCIQGPQQGLVFTDLGVWAMQYIGPPYVYSFNEIGNGCGLISRKAVGNLGSSTYWMGSSQFYRIADSGVQPVSCPIWDVIFQDLDQSNLDKIRVAVNSRFTEITWYYPTMSNGGEVNAYVKYNEQLGIWDYGTLSRSAWIDQSVVGKPIGADAGNRYLYQHETSPDADGQAMQSSFRTGYFVMSEADVKTFVDQVWPDMKWGYYGGAQNATVNLTFYVADYPGQTPTAFGPYPMTQNTTFLTPRFRGRLVSIQISSNDVGTFWRIGNIRYRLQQDGKF